MPNKLKSPNKKSFGASIELAARKYLSHKGLQFQQANYHCRWGEIDLIMFDQEVLVFIEVRYRQPSRFGSGLESVTLTKQHKLIRTAEHYLQQQGPHQPPCRFDVIAVTSTAKGLEFNWLSNAFGI